MESISPLIEPCTLHFGLLNEKEKKRETTQNKTKPTTVFLEACVIFFFLFPALCLAAPKGSDEWSLLQRGAGRHTGPGAVSVRAAQREGSTTQHVPLSSLNKCCFY